MSEIAPRPRAPSARTPAGLTSKPRRSPRAAATPAADKQRPTAAAQSEPLPRERAEHLARALAPWFLAHQRDLEWRHTRDPYAIWVSEVMLQQTRVDTVKSYWAPFMRRFPDLATLAAADEQQVLAAWSGLGYYHRARLVHAGVRHVHTTLAGRMPSTPDELREIPGIGRYTAGAIASIAHDKPAALVDGNVARVLSRLQAIVEPKQQAADAPGHWALTQQIVEAGSPRVLAQALMELGATVCTPQQPRCETCPVRPHCLAHARGLVVQIPAPTQRAPSPQHDLWAVGLRKAGRLLLTRRPREGQLAGMWCLPLIDTVVETPAVSLPTTDTLVEGIHFDPAISPPRLLGRKALSVNLSDIGAMSGVPRYALVNLCLPPTCPLEFVDNLYEGIIERAAEVGVGIVGGNLSATSGPVVISIPLLGMGDRPILRRGAQVGDLVVITGGLGASAEGMRLLREGVRLADDGVVIDTGILDGLVGGSA